MVDPTGFSACDDDGQGNIKCDVDGGGNPPPGSGICDPECPQLPPFPVTSPRLPGTSVRPVTVPPPNVQLILQSPNWAQILQPPQSKPATPCPSGALANFAYALYDFGLNAMKTGTVGAVTAKNGLLAAAPYAETPAGADAILVNESLGLASDFTFAMGAGFAVAGGGYLAFNGDGNPLNNTATTLAQTIGEDAANVPNLSPTDSLDAPFESMAGKSTCRKN